MMKKFISYTLDRHIDRLIDSLKDLRLRKMKVWKLLNITGNIYSITVDTNKI